MNQSDLGEPGELGGAFGQSAAALRGKLPLKQPPPVAPTVDTRTDNGTNEAAPMTEQTRQRELRQDGAAVDDLQQDDQPPGQTALPPKKAATYQVSVYLLPAAVQAAERIRRRSRKFNADIAFDALDALREDLNDLVAARQTAGRPADSLFPGRRGGSTRTTAAQQGRRQLWSLQATQVELEVMDQLAEKAGADSRSELISVAVEAYLAPPRRRSSSR